MSAGINELFTHTYRTWAPRIFNHFRRLSWTVDDASDLTADVFATAWTQIGEVRDPSRIGGWLWSIARNQAANRVRTDTRREAREHRAAEAGSPGAETDAAHMRLRRAFDALEQSDRQVLLWREYSGLTYREIAELTGTTEDSVRASLYRARVRLRDEYGKRWE